MADGVGSSERQMLGQFAKSQTKYGTTTIPVRWNSNFVKHKVVSTDSLIAIALKYGVSVEQLKRENKLWSNDALFLREYLLVPLTKENSQCIPENSEIVRVTSLKPENDSVRTLTTPSSPDGSCPSCDGEKATSTSEPDLSAKDFLNKYDSNIAQLKSNVQKMEESTSLQDVSLSAHQSPLRESWSHNSSRRCKPLSVNSMSKSISFGNDCSPPVLVIRSRTKQVQSTLQKSEQTNNELFQL